MRHCSSSLTLKQTEQNFTFALTSIRTSARRRTSAGSACSRWKAMRWALFGPTPGSRPSSSIRSWITPSYNEVPSAQAGQAARATPETTAQPLGDRTHRLTGQRLGLGAGVAVGGDDEIGEVGQVVGVVALELARPDRDAHQLPHAVDGDGDRTAGDGAVDGLLGEVGLCLLELLLHLLRLLEEGVHVEAAATEGVEGVLGHRVSRCRSGVGWGRSSSQSFLISSISLAPSVWLSSDSVSMAAESASGSSGSTSSSAERTGAAGSAGPPARAASSASRAGAAETGGGAAGAGGGAA